MSTQAKLVHLIDKLLSLHEHPVPPGDLSEHVAGARHVPPQLHPTNPTPFSTHAPGLKMSKRKGRGKQGCHLSM